MPRAAAVLALAVLLAASPAAAAGEMTLEVAGRMIEGEGQPRDAVRLSVATKADAPFAAKGSVSLGGERRAGTIKIEFKGERGPGLDRADVTVEGTYEVFFGNEQQGVEFQGGFEGAVSIAPGEERVLTEMEVAGDGPRRPPTRIQIVVRARR